MLYAIRHTSVVNVGSQQVITPPSTRKALTMIKIKSNYCSKSKHIFFLWWSKKIIFYLFIVLHIWSLRLLHCICKKGLNALKLSKRKFEAYQKNIKRNILHGGTTLIGTSFICVVKSVFGQHMRIPIQHFSHLSSVF